MSAVQYSEASPPLAHFQRRLMPEDSPINQRSISQDRLSLLRAGQSLSLGAPHGQNLQTLRSQHRQKRREQPGNRGRVDEETTEDESPSPSPANPHPGPAFSSSSEREELSPHSDFDDQLRREFVRKQQVRAKGGVDPYSQRDFQPQPQPQPWAPQVPAMPNRALPNPVPVRARSDGQPREAPSAFRPVAGGSRPSSGELPDFASDCENNTSASLAMPIISPYNPSRLIGASPMRYNSESDAENIPNFPPPPPPAQQPLKVSPAKSVGSVGSQGPRVALPSEPVSKSLAQAPAVPPRRPSTTESLAQAPAVPPRRPSTTEKSHAHYGAPLLSAAPPVASIISPPNLSAFPEPVLAPLPPHHPPDGLSASAAVRVVNPSQGAVLQPSGSLQPPAPASSLATGRSPAKEPPSLKLTVPVAQLRAHSPASGGSGSSSGSGARAPQSRTASRSPMQARTLPASREAPAFLHGRGPSHGALLEGSPSPSAEHQAGGFPEVLSPGAAAHSGLRVIAPSPAARLISVQPVPVEQRLGEMSPAARMLSPGAAMMVVAPEPSAYIYQPPSQRFFSPSPAHSSLSRSSSAGVLGRAIPPPLSADSLSRPVLSSASSAHSYEDLEPASGSGASIVKEYNPPKSMEDRLPASRLPERVIRHDRTHSLPPDQVVMASEPAQDRPEPAGPPPVRVEDVFEGLNPNILSINERQQFLNFFLDRAACLDERIALLKQTIAVQSVQDRAVGIDLPNPASRTLSNRQPSPLLSAPPPPGPAPRPAATLPRGELKEQPNVRAPPSPMPRSEKDAEFAVMYAYQLSLLKAMGFSDQDQCCAALIASHGDMQAAINILMDS